MEHDPLHGHSVARIIQRAAPDATYNFYQAIPGVDDAASEYRVGDLIPSIEQAVRDSVDVLNVSAGVDGKYSAELSYGRAVTTAVEAGVTIIAAAGNRDRVDRLCYPARASGVVAVGGCLVRCRRPNVDGHLRDRRIWTGSPENHDGPYCSAHGCTRRTGCKEARKRRGWWTENVEPHGEKPEVAAPCYSILHERYIEDPKEGHGTSFAAPIVTGSLARSMAARELQYAGEDLSEFLRAEGTDLGVDYEQQYQRVMFRNPE